MTSPDQDSLTDRETSPEQDLLADRGRLPSERAVLQILSNSPTDYLVRSHIHRRMPRDGRPTLGRVGQILGDFRKAGLVDVESRRSQGSRKAAFYRLSDRGFDLCQGLGLQRKNTLLFPITEEEIRSLLTRERLARPPGPPGRITAFWSYRGGLGITTTIAYAASVLSRRLPEDEKILVIDFDLGAPDLDTFYNPPPNCRGLGGILVDYQRQSKTKRSLWLLSALGSEKYVHRVKNDESPGLTFLPNGLSPLNEALSGAERAEALSLLNAETTIESPENRFLSRFRSAILSIYSRTLIDTQIGRSLSSWIATQNLADELVLCIRTQDTSPATLAGLRAVLACFLRHSQHFKHQQEESTANTTFLFQQQMPTNDRELDRWIDQQLIPESDGSMNPPCYYTEQLIHNRHLKNRTNHTRAWNQNPPYTQLASRLSSHDRTPRGFASPLHKLLMDVLEPTKPWKTRNIAAGSLSNLSLRDLGWLLESYSQDPSLHVKTDEKGEELIKNIVKAQSRKMLSVLSTPQRAPREVPEGGNL